MDFDLSEEQLLLKETVERLIADHYGFQQRRRYAEEAKGWSQDLWARYAELGLLGLPFAERDGGIGGGPIETMIVMEALGRALALEPYLATVVLAGGLIRHGGNDRQRAALVPAIAQGTLVLAFAHGERHARYELAHVETKARKDGTHWVLDGEKSLVLHGDTADRLLVTARISGAPRDRRGIGLFLLDANAAGLVRRVYATVDGLRAAEIQLAGVNVSGDDVLGEPGAAFPLVERVVDEAMAALAAEAVGAMAALHELTLDYLKTRRQFGAAIGSFQVLQHRAVDMLMALEQARSMAMFATMMASEADAVERGKAMAAAKVQIGRSAKLIGQQAIQLHGGIGMTMEYSAGHYFKRLTMIDTLFGTADHHLARLAEAGGLIES
ncbi:MAG: acyl-CoA dehydrogenase family protein [Proteobacteria bacterium]|nr:acyl-CoA dehydrogenase family protein [Pseudomonadota bacterium]MBI3498159.1 acyl-CoA dehydrogenase family protein [Pseudomonadota bacterium]